MTDVRITPFCGQCDLELFTHKWGLVCIVCGMVWPPMPQENWLGRLK